MLTVIAMGIIDGGVKIAITCLRMNIIGNARLKAACSSNFASTLSRKFKAKLLHDCTSAVRIIVGTATFRICIHAEIGAVIFKAYDVCFFQVVASTWHVIFFTAFLGLKRYEATTV